MSNQNQTDRPNRSGRTGGRAGTRQQINDLIRDRSPIRDESNQDVQINGERAKTVTKILKEQQAKIDGEGRDMMAKIFGAMEKLEKAYEEQKKANDAQKEINKDQKEINKELREEINDLKKTRNCSKCDQSVEAKKSYCGTCVHKG